MRSVCASNDNALDTDNAWSAAGGSNGRTRRHGWRKGAVTLRKLDVPVELEEPGAMPMWFDDSQASATRFCVCGLLPVTLYLAMCS